jgi:hypothetical protein
MKLFYLHIIPFEVNSTRKYSSLHTSLAGLEAFCETAKSNSAVCSIRLMHQVGRFSYSFQFQIKFNVYSFLNFL